MTPYATTFKSADYYFYFLKNLPANSKLHPIAKLSESLKEPEPNAEVSLEDLFVAWKSEETADEIIAALWAY